MVFKRIGFRRNWHAKGYVLDESYIHKDKLCYMHKDELYTQGHGIDVYIYIYIHIHTNVTYLWTLALWQRMTNEYSSQ